MNGSETQAKRMLVTGATGFVGRSLVKQLVQRNYIVRAATRSLSSLAPCVPHGVEVVTIPSIDGETDWVTALQGIDIVVHLAARTHVMHESNLETALYKSVNVDGTARLVAAAVAAGIEKVIYLSSIKVNGERTVDEPFSESSTPCPVGPYSHSKQQSEQALWSEVSGSRTRAVVIRPPMVYGPGAPGNFARLIGWIRSGIPIPLASVQNRRSFIYVENLCDAICACLENQFADGETFLVSDGEDISTPDLMRLLSTSLGRGARILPFPPRLLKYGAWAIGRSSDASRLLESLVVDSRKIRRVLGWVPPYSMESAARETSAAYLGQVRDARHIP